MAKVTDWHDLFEFVEDHTENYTEIVDLRRTYEGLSICPKCSSRRQETMDIKGQASNQVLAQRIVCKSCGTIIGEINLRDKLQEKLGRGEIMVKDVSAVERDLG